MGRLGQRVWWVFAALLIVALTTATLSAQSPAGTGAAAPSDTVAMTAYRDGLAAILQPAERRRLARAFEGWPAKWRARGAVATGERRAIKVERGEEVADKSGPASAGFPELCTLLAGAAMRDFLPQALTAAGLDVLAGQVRAIPEVRDVRSATLAEQRLRRLAPVSGRARPALEATMRLLTLTRGQDAARATAGAMASVVEATLRSGAPRQAVIDRAIAVLDGR